MCVCHQLGVVRFHLVVLGAPGAGLLACRERVSFEGLANAEAAAPARVNKKKLFPLAAEGLRTTADCFAAHNGRKMMTSVRSIDTVLCRCCLRHPDLSD